MNMNGNDNIRNRRRLSAADIETGGALVEHLQGMGVDVTTDLAGYRKALHEARHDNSLTGKVRYMRDSQDRTYGFTYRGRIHLDITKMDGELPLHEYAHLWCESLRQLNRESWDNVVGMMKSDADTWDFIRNSHPGITGDDDLAEEAVATYSGRKGADRLSAELERMAARDSSYRSKWGNIFRNIGKSLQDLWKQVGTYLNLEYRSAGEVYDRVLKDFVDGVNPRKDIEKHLQARDGEYMDAVRSGDIPKATYIFSKALKENVGNGMTPWLTAGNYRDLRRLARRVKTGDREAINEAAGMMAPFIPADAVLVPAPAHTGEARDMLALSYELSRQTGAPVRDILHSDERESQYAYKKENGHAMKASELGIRATGDLPEGKIPVVIDNVISSGNTAEACVKALGTGIVLCLANADGEYTRAATLKSASPVMYDRKGQVIPLSRRFDLSLRTKRRMKEESNYRTNKNTRIMEEKKTENNNAVGPDKNGLSKEIKDMTAPYTKDSDGMVFIAVGITMEENEAGKHARQISGQAEYKVISLGLLCNRENDTARLVYEHSHNMENGQRFHTILGRGLEELNRDEMIELRNRLKLKVASKNVVPFMIREEDGAFHAMSGREAGKILNQTAEEYDGEETGEKRVFLFKDFDDAIGFASEGTALLENVNERKNTAFREAGEFAGKNNQEPLYVEAEIRFKEDGAAETQLFKLSSDMDSTTDDAIFFYCDGIEDFMRLMDLDNGEDFAVTGKSFDFHDRTYLMSDEEALRYRNGTSISELAADKQKEVLDVIREKYGVAAERHQEANQERAYRIHVGTFPGLNDIFGDIHVEFLQPINAVSSKEMSRLAEGMGGDLRIMGGKEWADFDRMADAERFAEMITKMNRERMEKAKEARENMTTQEQPVQGLKGYSNEDVRRMVREHIEDIIGQNPDLDMRIKEVTLTGSRARGEARAGSDLDVLVEYEGKAREDALFNILNEEPMRIGGVKVDINPINPKYSLSTPKWLERDARWRREDRLSDITIFSVKGGGMGIKCKIDGRQTLSKALRAEDVRSLTEKTDRKALAAKYFARELENNRERKNSFKR